MKKRELHIVDLKLHTCCCLKRLEMKKERILSPVVQRRRDHHITHVCSKLSRNCCVHGQIQRLLLLDQMNDRSNYTRTFLLHSPMLRLPLVLTRTDCSHALNASVFWTGDSHCSRPPCMSPWSGGDTIGEGRGAITSQLPLNKTMENFY